MASSTSNKPQNEVGGSGKPDDKTQGVQEEKTSAVEESNNAQTTTTVDSTMRSKTNSTIGDNRKKDSEETEPKLDTGGNFSKMAPRSKKRKAGQDTAVACSQKEGEHPTIKKNQSRQVFRGMIEFPLEPLKRHLTCYCCKGYFREPYTVAECLHTFCKSCLFLKFHSGMRKCPKCEISLDPDPYKAVLCDRTLQELLDKIFPELKELDEQRELEFYKKRGIEFKDNVVVEEAETGKSDSGNWSARESKESQTTQSNMSTRSDNALGPDRLQSNQGYKDFCIPTDEINFKLIPDNKVKIPMNPLENPLIRTSGQLKVGQIKKYLVNKLKLLGPTVSKIRILGIIQILV